MWSSCADFAGERPAEDFFDSREANNKGPTAWQSLCFPVRYYTRIDLIVQVKTALALFSAC